MNQPEGYSEILAYLLSKYGTELTVEQVAAETGYSKGRVTQKTYGWSGKGRGKKLKTAVFARQMCGR